MIQAILLIFSYDERMDKEILNIQDLSIYFRNKKVVDNVCFNIKRGKCLGLVGESGSGKTLSALSILQLLPVTAVVSNKSTIIYNGQDLLNFSEKQMRNIRGKKIAVIFQDAMSAFNPVLTIGFQLTEILLAHTELSKEQAKKTLT